MESGVELPFDVSTQFFLYSPIHSRFLPLANAFFLSELLPMTLENDYSNKNKDAKNE